MKKFKKILAQVFLTHVGRIFLLGIPLTILGGAMSFDGVLGDLIRNPMNDVNLDKWNLVMGAGIIILGIEVAIMFGYLFVYLFKLATGKEK